MVKRNVNGRKSGSIAVIEDPTDIEHEVEEAVHEEAEAAAPKKERKPKAEPQQDGTFGVGDVRKAAAFVNSIGGLDKAIAVLQILKVAKEVQ
ncbi:MAG: hypothetical protein C0483_20175 [Pirellula sp.]|nr:hypothetical protein [Pirellula sp.]